MLVCKDCGRIFTESEALPELIDGVEGGYVDLCPYCGSEDVAYGNEDRF